MASKKPTTELVTVPNFIFPQGDPFDYENEGGAERPIEVRFYNGSIELIQKGDYKQPETILIDTKYLKELFNEIQAHLPEAEKRWK